MDASVVGRTFWRGVLAKLDPEPGLDTGAALGALEAREFIRRQSVSEIEGDDAYTFRHASIREVASTCAPRRAQAAPRRRRPPRRGAFRRAAGHAVMLAHHWCEAGEPRAHDQVPARGGGASRPGVGKAEAVGLYTQVLGLLADDDRRKRTLTLRELSP